MINKTHKYASHNSYYFMHWFQYLLLLVYIVYIVLKMNVTLSVYSSFILV